MPHVIITGGSSGIGLEIARLYLQGGWRVSLIARREEMLTKAVLSLKKSMLSNSGEVFVASADVRNEGAVHEAIKKAEEVQGPCDVLVTSAGRVDPQDFAEQSAADFEAQLSVNFLGTVYAVRAVLAGMKQRASGRLVLISSGAALIGIPGYAAYCASKSALASFAEALRAELFHSGVTVTIGFPPDTLTPQYQQEIALRSHEAQFLMGRVRPWSVEKVAHKVVDGAEKGRREIHFGCALKLMSLFSQFIKPVLFLRLKRMSAQS